MNTSVNQKLSNPPSITFASTMIVTLVSSLMVEQGIGIAISSAFVNFGGAKEKSSWLVILALILFIGGNLILGLCLKLGWPGLISGFLSPIVGIIAWWFAGSGIPYSLNNLPSNLILMLGFGIIATGMISTLLIGSSTIRTYQGFIGLVLGIGIGILISFSLLNIIEQPMIAGVTFCWVWLSALFFFGLLSKQAGWRDALIWMTLMCTTPFWVLIAIKVYEFFT